MTDLILNDPYHASLAYCEHGIENKKDEVYQIKCADTGDVFGAKFLAAIDYQGQILVLLTDPEDSSNILAGFADRNYDFHPIRDDDEFKAAIEYAQEDYNSRNN